MMKKRLLLSTIFILFQTVYSQSRIEFNNQQLFLSGSNVAWVNFARDIGPGSTNFNRFREIFAELKAAGGNSFRLWLHTTGETTPEFNNTTNMVVGPGAGAIDDLEQILDIAWENEIGLMLCLWSHDMMATSRSAILDRNEKLLTDTSAIRAYINNALIPMVQAVKGHPAILAWEIFNEPEGFTEIGAWGDRRLVRQFDVQRFVNLTAGAIHRTDPSVQVTSGTWGLTALTDIPTVAKISADDYLNSFTNEEKRHMEDVFETKYGTRLFAEEIIRKFYNTNAANMNYYRKDRLIEAGGDTDGYLDFYTVHYYSWAGTVLSPFHHPYSYWNLDLPLAIAEFFMEDAAGMRHQDLYRQLYNTGYAGALSWQWWGDTQANDNAKNGNHEKTIAAVQDIFNLHPNDVTVNPVTGTIYSFTSSSDTIDAGESVVLKWITAAGSTPVINGSPVQFADSLVVTPDSTTIYTLTTNNDTAQSASITVEVLFPGIILSFTASKTESVEKGETVLLKWSTSKGSSVKLEDSPVAEDDSLQVLVNETTTFRLITESIIKDTAAVTINVLPSGMVLSFAASPLVIGTNEETSLKWETSGGSVVMLNGSAVGEDDSLIISLAVETSFTLIADGDIKDTSVITVYVLEPEMVNRALGKPVTVSSGINSNYINDGKPETVWSSSEGGSQWVNINLDGEYAVDKIIVRWGNSYARNFRIANYWHPVYYHELYSEINSTGGTDTILISDTLRVMKVFLDRSLQQQVYSIRDIEIYGVPVILTDTEDVSFIKEYELFQNYPNPFNPRTHFGFRIPARQVGGQDFGLVTLKVYDILGNEIATIVNSELPAGSYTYTWDASGFASGIYFYKLESGSFIDVKKLVLIK